MTRSARHGETMIDCNNASPKDRGDHSCTQRGSASSRWAVAHERGELTKSDYSGALSQYMGPRSPWEETALLNGSVATPGGGIASPQLLPSTGGHVDEKSSVVPPSERGEARGFPSGSSSTMSRFVERLEASVCSLSSLRTIRSIPSWRSTLTRAHNTYAKIECDAHDDGCGDGGSDSDAPPSVLPRVSGGGAGAPSSSSGNNNFWNDSVRRGGRHDKRTRGPNNVFHTSLSDILSRFSHAMSNSTGGHHGPGTTATASCSSSLGTHPSSSLGSRRVPFPSNTSEESSSSSSSSYPSPYSADAVAAFQAPRNTGDAPYFDGRVKYRGIFEDHIQVDFAEATHRTSTSTHTGTSTSTTSVRVTSKPHRLLTPLRRRVSAMARSVTPTRSKFPTIFHKDRRPPRRPVDDEDDFEEYDIPCLAYITCLW